jgi:hypothetical protein
LKVSHVLLFVLSTPRRLGWPVRVLVFNIGVDSNGDAGNGVEQDAGHLVRTCFLGTLDNELGDEWRIEM